MFMHTRICTYMCAHTHTNTLTYICIKSVQEVQEEIPSEEANTLQIGSVAFPPGQCTNPQLHPCY